MSSIDNPGASAPLQRKGITMALVQFVTDKKGSKYQIIGVRSCNVSDRALIAEYNTIEEAHKEWNRLEMIPQSPFSDERERIFNEGQHLGLRPHYNERG